jgi:hypothetical protein
VLGVNIRVSGNVAMAVAGCAMTENGDQINRGVEMLLLVKSDGYWQIVSQAMGLGSTVFAIATRPDGVLIAITARAR